MKRFLTVLTVVLFTGGIAFAEDKADKSADKSADKKVKTVSGKSSCATCDGLPVKGHKIMLTAEDGTRWVLEGDDAAYKAAHKVRKDGKKMTATLASEPVTKKDEDGKEYKEAKISEIKVVEDKA